MFSAINFQDIWFQKTAKRKHSRLTDRAANSSSIFVAGINITTWPIVEIDVPAGPLGMLFDGSCADAAILDDFAPVDLENTPGAVETSGKVPFGSVLVGMDLIDFTQQPRKTFSEIGTALREAAHLNRHLIFRVPFHFGSTVDSTTKSQDNDKSCLAFRSSSSATHLLENNKSVTSAGERPTLPWSRLCAPTTRTTLNSSGISTESHMAPPAQVNLEMTKPIALKLHDKISPHVQISEMESLGFELDMCSFVSNSTDQILKLEEPPESLEVKFDDTNVDRAVVQGYKPLPDDFSGMSERSGSLSSGAGAVKNCGENSQELLPGIRERFIRLSDGLRRLSFCPSPSIELLGQSATATSTAPDISAARRISAVSIQRLSLVQAILPTYTEDLVLRRRLELELVMKYDRKELKSREFWFVIHARWMKRWSLFVGKEGQEPGPITNCELLMPGFIAGVNPNQAVTVRSDIEVMKDFRFVTPMVWSLLAALHGPGDAPPIARFSLDINSDAPEDVNEVLSEAKGQAKGLATSLREKCKVVKCGS